MKFIKHGDHFLAEPCRGMGTHARLTEWECHRRRAEYWELQSACSWRPPCFSSRPHLACGSDNIEMVHFFLFPERAIQPRLREMRELMESVWRGHRALASITLKDSYLVDPTSSQMLVSKIKPCMWQYKPS